MERLIDNELIYGSLMPVARPHLVERYNLALDRLGTPKTKLEEFSVDATGFSPEIARELDDAHYLDPHGVNRRFIILSPDQGKLPVLQINFSSTTDMVAEFFARNMDALRLLTLKDAVFGEMENSTYRVDDIDDILAIKSVRFRVRTSDALLDKARDLDRLITRFRREDEAWRDTALMERITELAEDCGDIRTHNPVPHHVEFAQRSFWTRHFGGVYVFHDARDRPVVIGHEERPDFAGDLTEAGSYLSLQDPEEVYSFLVDTGRLEATNFEWLQSSPLLDLRIEACVREAIARAEPDVDLVDVDDTWIRNWVHDRFDDLSESSAFATLLRLRKQVRNRATLPKEVTSGPLRFAVTRAIPGHPERALVNRLASELVPFDFLMRFLYNKEAFHADYRRYPENYRRYVEHMVKSAVLPDPEMFRDRLFH